MVVAAVGIAALFAISYLTRPSEHWPNFAKPADLQRHAEAQTRKWKKPTAIWKYTEHLPVGGFLKPTKPLLCQDTPGRKIDDEGLPLAVNESGEFRHPVMTAACGLAAYNWSLNGGDGMALVRRHADLLISLQDEEGAFRYPFAWRHHLLHEKLAPGWASSMSQGEGMALFLRAWHISKDERYLEAGEKALDYLLTPVSEGGVATTLADLDPSLSSYIFFEEYAAEPATYTLNGYMYTLFGLYDWSKAAPEEFGREEAAEAFAKGIKTLSKILPYYDMGTISSYDLGYITYPRGPILVRTYYHETHVRQLDLLFRLTGIPAFRHFSQKWEGYVTAARAVLS